MMFGKDSRRRHVIGPLGPNQLGSQLSPSGGLLNQQNPRKGMVGYQYPSGGLLNQQNPGKGMVGYQHPSGGLLNQLNPGKGMVGYQYPSGGMLNQFSNVDESAATLLTVDPQALHQEEVSIIMIIRGFTKNNTFFNKKKIPKNNFALLFCNCKTSL